MDALSSNQQAPSPPPPQVNLKVIQEESCRLNGELIGVPTGSTAVRSGLDGLKGSSAHLQ